MKTKSIAISAVIAAASACMPAHADNMPSDTLAVVRNAHTVLVTKSPSSDNITVIGQGDDRNFYYSYSSEKVDSAAIAAKSNDEWGLSLPFLREYQRKKSEVIWGGHSQIGICMPVDGPRGLDQSIDLAIGKIVGLNYTPWTDGPVFSFGAGIFAQKFVLHGGRMFDRDGKSLVMVDLPEGAGDTHVRLFNFGFEMPFTVTQTIYDDFSFSAGVVMKFNTYTTASNKYTIDNRSYEQSFKGLQQRILTYDIFGAIGWDEFSLYFRYSPVSLFRRADGPQFDVISFGVNLGF
ncbi:MAG: hypothetical protein K2L55_03635 [Muribaculaceae bacterium]|nr:hypothetical protein [Muribaculaceae bacterium]MDE6345743.1 hypothetical protein [Muribaculaceae bacterium]